jgi:hypothetical protein
MPQIAWPMARGTTGDTTCSTLANSAKEHISEHGRRTWPGLRRRKRSIIRSAARSTIASSCTSHPEPQDTECAASDLRCAHHRHIGSGRVAGASSPHTTVRRPFAAFYSWPPETQAQTQTCSWVDVPAAHASTNFYCRSRTLHTSHTPITVLRIASSLMRLDV